MVCQPSARHSTSGAREGYSEECRCVCTQCCASNQPFTAPRQPRWGHDRELLCCLYDSRRRVEQIRRAKAHVQRNGYQAKLEKICNASAEKVDAAIACVGPNGSVRDVLRSPECDPELKEALVELMIFTTVMEVFHKAP